MQVTQIQVREFLTATRNLNVWPSETSELEHAVQEKAARTREAVRHCFAIEVPTDFAAVNMLDDLLNAMHEAMRPKFWSWRFGKNCLPDDAAAVSASIGSCVGELAKSRMGGEWGYREFQGERHIMLILSPSVTLAVLHKAGKQFLNGKSDSIQLFFGIAGALAAAKAKFENLPQKERDALKAKMERERTERKTRMQTMTKEERKVWRREAAEAGRKARRPKTEDEPKQTGEDA